MEKLVVAVAGLLLIALLTTIPALLYLCFDNWLSQATGNPAFQELGFWRAWAVTLFIGMLFGRKPRVEKK